MTIVTVTQVNKTTFTISASSSLANIVTGNFYTPYTLAFPDGLVVGDSIRRFNYLKSPNLDVVNTTDSFSRTVQYTRFVMPVYVAGYFGDFDYIQTETVRLTDSLRETFSKVLTRTANITDAGALSRPELYASGYFNLDYVNPIRTW